MHEALRLKGAHCYPQALRKEKNAIRGCQGTEYHEQVLLHLGLPFGTALHPHICLCFANSVVEIV